MSDVRLPADDRVRLGEYVREHGVRKAAKDLEINAETLKGALAGLGIRRGTLAQLREKLLERPSTVL
jgi:hypothetical protein